MKFTEKKMWKQRTRAKSEEKFLGNLRAKVDEEAESFLKPLILKKRVIRNGMIFEYYEDKVEVHSVYEEIQEMIEDIRAKEKLK